jgi:hypothetical protein
VKIPEQIKRLAIVVGVLLVAVVVGRFVVIPRSLVARELHESSTVAREMAKPVAFAGSTACGDCHDEVVVKKSKGYHRNLACEGCHGPAAKHADDPSAVKPAAPRDQKFCPVCHTYDAARPTGFPQINPTAHNPLKPCITCHNAHDPVPPRTPRDCSACHAQIERTKAVSSHALLACTTCHTVPDQHKKSPRTATPSKPETREFCGQCHAKDGAAKDAPALTGARKDAPKVDLGSHGRSYQCWQCHYPHLPEGRV